MLSEYEISESFVNSELQNLLLICYFWIFVLGAAVRTRKTSLCTEGQK